ncbi:MAG: hypothetical protein KKE29_19870 [Proteobacteria bacterium]|nr:hypothetical protein [Pseudomonadota bacterium]MBU4574433.1 hypothetical protein [Pseudomonadota bacterium]MBV1715948.1 hypothetical protein [Desulfarculus sp.]
MNLNMDFPNDFYHREVVSNMLPLIKAGGFDAVHRLVEDGSKVRLAVLIPAGRLAYFYALLEIVGGKPSSFKASSNQPRRMRHEPGQSNQARQGAPQALPAVCR